MLSQKFTFDASQKLLKEMLHQNERVNQEKKKTWGPGNRGTGREEREERTLKETSLGGKWIGCTMDQV